MVRKSIVFALLAVPAFMFAQDGTYKGVGKGGKRGDIAVDVKLVKGKIADVVVTQCKEDRPKNSLEVLKAAVIKANSVNVDIVSGASMTSRGYLDAVNNALMAAGKAFKGTPKK